VLEAGRPQAFHLADDRGGFRFCLVHRPIGPVRAAVLQVPAWGPEQHAMRHACASTARALARAGALVLQHDLLGCGDSSGDEAEATASTWWADLWRAHRWLKNQAPGLPMVWWPQRAGALLAASAWPQRPDDQPACPVQHVLAWQPVLNGAALQQHWLRSLGAAALATGQASAAATSAARQAWARGEAVTVAGQVVPAALFEACADWAFAPPQNTGAGRLQWLDVQATPRPLAAPAAQALQVWMAGGWQAQHQTVAGPSFWQNFEVLAPAELAQQSVLALEALLA
jgi:exosortase A-associated hydrolase 2